MCVLCYSRLSDRVFSERVFRTLTRILLYEAVVLTTLLYGWETWVAYRRHLKTLEQFQKRAHRELSSVYPGKHSSHVAIKRNDQITHISTTVYSQVRIYTDESTGASMERTKMPNLRNGSNGDSNTGLT